MTEVTCAIIVDSGCVLATQRSSDMPHALKWEFPGGKLKEGETPEICIKREILEELGLQIKVDRLLPSVKFTYGNRNIKLIPFVCSMVSGKISLTEHHAFRWVNREELKELDWLEADVEVVNAIVDLSILPPA